MDDSVNGSSTTQVVTESEVVNAPVEVKATKSQSIEYIVYFVFTILEILLAFRFILKLAGASLSSGFVTFIYDLSGFFVYPFEGIFRKTFTEGAETTSVFEPSTFVAILVYAVVAWGVIVLARILSRNRQEV